MTFHISDENVLAVNKVGDSPVKRRNQRLLGNGIGPAQMYILSQEKA
jgi:hypothetical protein